MVGMCVCTGQSIDVGTFEHCKAVIVRLDLFSIVKVRQRPTRDNVSLHFQRAHLIENLNAL